MIKVMRKDDRTVTIICCDVCGSWIDEAGLGAAVFRRLSVEGDTSEVLHAHKGRCHEVAEERLGETGWQELRQHLYHLTSNTGLPPEALQKLEDDDNLFGTL